MKKLKTLRVTGILLVTAVLGAHQKVLKARKSVTGGAYLWEHWNGERNPRTRDLIAKNVCLMKPDPLDNEFCKRITGQVLAESLFLE